MSSAQQVDGSDDKQPKTSRPGTPSTSRPPSRSRQEEVPSIFGSGQTPLRQNAPRFRRADSKDEVPRIPPVYRPRQGSISTTSEGTEYPTSPDPADRVFPIRSFVSVDPTATSQPRSDRGDYFSSAATGRRNSKNSAPSSPRLGSTREDDEGGTNASQGTRSRAGGSDIDPLELINNARRGSGDAKPDNNNVAASGQGYQIHADAQSARSESLDSRNGRRGNKTSISAASNRSIKESREPEDVSAIYTARFKHVVTEGGHAVITGRDGETLQRCEDEPIHIPGAIQSFGVMLALREDEDGKLAVRVVSENSKRLLGYTPKQLFSLDSFTDIFSEEQADNLLDHIDFIKDDGTDVEANGPEVFTISIRNQHRRAQKLWCAIHITDKNPDLIICEFELEDDPQYPLVPAHEQTPEPPEDTLQSEPTADELKESTETRSRPLRVLRSARKRRGEAAAMEVFNIMSQVQEQLAEAPTLDSFLKVLVGVVKELTGFHRVMIYQFDSNWDGKVVTELVDPRATKDLYKGLHFPASDIPKQARDLYMINRVRLLYDRDLQTARLVCRTIQDLETPLDMTHSYLRAMSPIHIKYLENMAVRSSMSISINAFNELWGLISCHTYGSKGTRVSFPIRKMCRLVGDSASRNIERLSYASRLQARKLINTSSSTKNPTGYIVASSDDLLKLFDADYGLLSIYGETKILGTLQGTQEALVLLEYFRMRKITAVTTSHDIKLDFPDLRYPPGFQIIAGLLLVPLTVGGNDFIIFFRKGQLKEVKWAGNPYEKYVKEGTEGYLEPRKSFKSWTEQVVGKCRDWTEEEIETAAVLCLVYGKFIEVWRQKEAALQNTQLTKLLLANSAHEVRTPLNAIINYLEIALEGSLDTETRDNLAKSHSASKSLIYVINDLLDLTKTESSMALVHEEAFDLAATFREAVEAFQGDARRKQIDFTVLEAFELPEKVLGDQRRVRQAISNITANAIQATTEGGVTVEMHIVGRLEDRVEVEVIVQDTGVGMSSEQLDSLFAELEQAQSENGTLIDRAFGDPPAEEPKEEKRLSGLGLGLAVVARIVRNMDGQLRVKSEPGKGSRFVVQFPFDLPASESRQALMPDNTSTYTSSVTATETPTENTTREGEVTLVDRATPRRGSLSSEPRLSRHNSHSSSTSLTSKRSMTSLNSGRSIASAQSGKSDADRLIEAISEPVGAQISAPIDRQKHRTISHMPREEQPGSVTPTANSWSVDATGKPLPEHLRAMPPATDGRQNLTDSSAPIKAVKMPDEGSLTSPTTDAENRDWKRIEELDDAPLQRKASPLNAEHLRVLIAEDDPINSKIVKKRLERLGHEPIMTVNGEECSDMYCDKPGTFDVVLMDMQMPILDGLAATKMIRSFEKSKSKHGLSTRASLNGRVPIIAVSASLIERERQMYTDSGFDGWILKPISFPRLSELLKCIVDDKLRAKNIYKQGHWEEGGWFQKAQPDIHKTNTSPEVNRIPASGPSNAMQQAVEAEKTNDPAGVSKHMQQARAEGQEDEPQNRVERPVLQDLDEPVDVPAS